MAKTPETYLINNKKNYIINGNMEIAQRGTSFATALSGSFLADRFQYIKQGAMVHTISQDNDVPTVAQSGYYFKKSIRATLTTPDTTIGATDYNFIRQKIEGYNFAELAQKPFTLSFWVKATTPGTYCVAFVNSINDRSFISEYTINASNTWEYKTITATASPVSGTWDYTNGIGLSVCWTICSGTNFQTTANTWATGDYLATANQVNGTNTGSTDFRLTGVMINSGYSALPFRLYAEDFESEVRACERYYEKTYALSLPPGSIITNGAHAWGGGTATGNRPITTYTFRAIKRATPSAIFFYNVQTGSQVNPIRDVDASVNYGINTGVSSEKAISITPNGTPPATALLYVHITLDAEL